MLFFAPPLVTPYAMRAATSIGEVRGTQGAKRREMSELRVPLGATYDNPFDPDDVTLDLIVTPPDGVAYTVPGFLTRDYVRSLESDKEVLTPAGPPEWRIRWTPNQSGATKLVLRLKDRTGTVEKTLKADVAAGDAPGFARISSRDGRYFETEDGKAYFPIGANVCWATPKGTYDYDDWFSRYGAAGANYSRLWLSPDWTTFALERTGKREDGLGMGQFDLGNAWRIDKVLDIAKANGMRLMLCIDSFNILRDREGANYWEKTPHNSDNGGPLRIWSDFWTDSEMDKLYRAKLRYLVARYGPRSETFSWELWNEVDIVRDFDPTRVREWHRRMGGWLADHDPYHHPVTTSFGDTPGKREIDTLPELDYVQTHHYSSPDIVKSITEQIGRKSSWNKPHYVGEIGADWRGPRAEDDPQGMQIHDPLWVSLATGASGGAMPWWWDSYIAPNNLYSIFQAATKFAKDIDWPSEGFRIVTPTFAYQVKPRAPRRVDLAFENGPVSWAASAVNKPRTVTVSRAGRVTGRFLFPAFFMGCGTISICTTLSGSGWIFRRKTRFEVGVSRVSRLRRGDVAGGARRRTVMTRRFEDKSFDQTDDIHAYDGVYGSTCLPEPHRPCGEHRHRLDDGHLPVRRPSLENHPAP